MRFASREEAGRMLAVRLADLRDEVVVIGMMRGGIPVAYEVARLLRAPLDLVVTRKISAGDGEPAVGALAEGGGTYLNPTVLSDGRVTHEEALRLADEAVTDLAARMRLFRAEFPAARLEGRTVVVVNDYVATGMTARAAARAARARGATRVLLAVPVLEASVEPELRREFDGVVALERATGPELPTDYYERLEDVGDHEALQYLRRALQPRLAGAPAGAG